LIAVAGTAPVLARDGMRMPETNSTAGVAESSLDSLPLVFEQNLGQSHPRVRFVARGAAFDAFLTDEGANVVVGRSDHSVIQIRPVQGRKSSLPQASDRLPGTTNYFIGDDPSRYIVDANTFARVKYESIYPGIDIVFYGTQRELEYDLVVAPRADPRTIALELQGIDRLKLLPEGSLALHTPSGDVEFRKPVAYQDIRGTRRDVDVRYALLAKNRIGFRLGRYDVGHPLVIDPILAISTNLWGTSTGVALDPANNIYVVGFTSKTDLLPVADCGRRRCVCRQAQRRRNGGDLYHLSRRPACDDRRSRNRRRRHRECIRDGNDNLRQLPDYTRCISVDRNELRDQVESRGQWAFLLDVRQRAGCGDCCRRRRQCIHDGNLLRLGNDSRCIPAHEAR